MPQMTQFLWFSAPKFWETKISVDLRKKINSYLTENSLLPLQRATG